MHYSINTDSVNSLSQTYAACSGLKEDLLIWYSPLTRSTYNTILFNHTIFIWPLISFVYQHDGWFSVKHTITVKSFYALPIQPPNDRSNDLVSSVFVGFIYSTQSRGLFYHSLVCVVWRTIFLGPNSLCMFPIDLEQWPPVQVLP